MQALIDQLAGARVYDLAQPYFVGMPHYPTHPPFLYSLTKRHGDVVTAGGVSSAADALALGSHVGTHIDALCHFSCGGKLHGGVEAAGVQSFERGLGHLSIDTAAPLVRRGVLLDVAGMRGEDSMEQDYEITPRDLDEAVSRQGVAIGVGDVVLLRTGWGRFWNEPARFVNNMRGPGPGAGGAHWLSERGVVAAGSDTVSFERVPAAEMPVHAHLLVECGIHIIECLNLEEAAAAHAYSFLFVAAPLKLRGATGSPIRPLAIVP